MAQIPPFDPTKPKNPWEKFMSRVAELRPMTWALINVGNRIDPVLMRISNGHLKMAPGAPIVVLHNMGAKSGKLRRTPLGYISDGDDVVLVASKGGAPKHPAWLHNVKANPDIELWVGRRGGPYRARVASAEERARLWRLLTQFYPGFDDYQRRAGEREIQVVICSPAG